MKITTILGNNSLKQNSYIVEDNASTILIDCGSTLSNIQKEYYKENKRQLKKIDAIFLTHTHFDHTCGLESVITQYKIPVFVKGGSSNWIADPYYNASGMFNRPLTYSPKQIKEIEGEQEIIINGLKIKPYFTPGHTDCSMCYLINNYLFTGDTKFYLTVGRTDLPTGDDTKLNNSLKFIKSIKCELCYPGHGIPFKN